MTRALPKVRRLVIKIGSAVIAPQGVLDPRSVQRLARDIAPLLKAPKPVAVTLVSSGAIASGFRALGLSEPPKAIAAKQAAAAIGQPRLMTAWSEAFEALGLSVAQTLYTADDLESRPRSLNARRTLAELHRRGVVPIVNENDTTSFDEIKLGDNDRLSALTAALVLADLLLILSTAHGLYHDGDPTRIIPTVRSPGDAQSHVQPEKSATGVGGMATKLDAAGLAASWGIPTIVAGGSVDRVVPRVLAGEELGTLFVARASGAGRRKRWLAGAARARGTIVVDDGAARAITQRGASLLPSGIVGVTGSFTRGTAVDIADRRGRVLARGLANFSGVETSQIKGLKSAQVVEALGYFYAPEVVHRDDLVLLAPREVEP
jgi:glutamate 5-kinase